MTFLLNIIISHILRIKNVSQGQDYTVSTYAVLGDKSIIASAGFEPTTLLGKSSDLDHLSTRPL